MSGCVPIGACGLTRAQTGPPSNGKLFPLKIMNTNTLYFTKVFLPLNASATNFIIPTPSSPSNSSSSVVSHSHATVHVGVYSHDALADAPSEQIISGLINVSTENSNLSVIPIDHPITMSNGSYWLAMLVIPDQSCSTILDASFFPPTVNAVSLYSESRNNMNLPVKANSSNLIRNSSGLDLKLVWTPLNDECNTHGGTLPPQIVKHAGDHGDGRLDEPGKKLCSVKV